MSINVTHMDSSAPTLALSASPDVVVATEVHDQMARMVELISGLLSACPEPHLDAVSAGDPKAVTFARIRGCAGAFARVAADILCADELRATERNMAVAAPAPSDPDALTLRETWRQSVLDLAVATRKTASVLFTAGHDPRFADVCRSMRALLVIAEEAAAALEQAEPPAPAVSSIPAPAQRTERPKPVQNRAKDGFIERSVVPKPVVEETGAKRRRPWFGADTSYEEL
ncbi:MAG: hypothetical protein QOG53_1871 [Frankiales bacterium]|jgi:hypothetical protein|nr:hypothetical protein [Frankiales bacterium]